MSGYDYDVDGTLEKKFGKTKCSNSPIDEYGKIEAGRRGSVTLSWQYQNDNKKRIKVELMISFLDNKGNILGKTGTAFNDLKEFESKRFVGHSKWNENFYSCQIEIK